MLTFIGKEPLLRCHWTDPETGANGYLIIDSLIAGVAAGGCRMRKGLTEQEVIDLAQTMTLKFALHELPIGGGKCGIDFAPDSPEADAVLTRFLQSIKPYLKENYMTGQDLGTREEQILDIYKKIGVTSLALPPIVQWGIEENIGDKAAKALKQPVHGQITIEMFIAGYGVSQCALEALARKGIPVPEAKVGVQGFGNVGGGTALDLYKAGAKIVGVADVSGAVVCEEGLDIDILINCRDKFGNIIRDKLPGNYRLVPGEEIFGLDCDVFIPAAGSYTVDIEAARRLKATIVVEGANNGITPPAEEFFCQQRVLVVPDFLANSAFALCMGAFFKQQVSFEAKDILEFISIRQREITAKLWESFVAGKKPRAAVLEIARNNLAGIKIG